MNTSMMGKHNAWQATLWSIAIPGFGQIINGKYIKGLTLIALELLINMHSSLNTIIIYSFQGQIMESINATNYQWLMFYPCIYLFAIWDAYNDADQGKTPLLFMPFALAAYSGTIGVIFSNTFTIKNIYLGPLWSFLFFVPIGLGIGFFVRFVMLRYMTPRQLSQTEQ